ncbi:unnamed protein product [Somion occarium]|uniref:mRNA export factor GLE1 n=1 Tax=Somion occarium TaxID=3059160 RepID=A0ABP1E135_9APHY
MNFVLNLARYCTFHFVERLTRLSSLRDTMKFSAPRSISPSPVRREPRPTRRRSTFGLPPDSSDEEYGLAESDEESVSTLSSSASSDSFCYASESEVPPPQPKPRTAGRSLEDQYHKEDTIASIRLRVRHKDPYEEWEHQTRRDAFLSARNQQTRISSQLRRDKKQLHSKDANRLAALHTKQMQEVEAALASFKLQQQTEEQKLREQWRERDRQLWQRIENVIQFEENKVKAKLEAERKKREEEERKRKEAELQKRLAEEKKKEEEERKRREEEEKQKELQRQEEEKRKQAELDKQRAEHLKAEEEERKKLGLTTAEDDWRRARSALKALKAGPMKTVKSNKELKSLWSAARRQITPKVGQLTDDPQTVSRVSQQIVEIMRPSQPYPPEVYLALLSSLSKTILMQAETEVTAEKHSALPIAQVTVNLLWTLEGFSEIFFAKLCQRVGGWPIPFSIPATDVDGKTFSNEERTKAMGIMTVDGQDEGLSEHTARVAGIMRVYFHILFAPTPKPLDPLFRLPRYWTWFARILTDSKLLESPVAPELISTALEVGGFQARDIWGQQWVKLLGILYEGVTTGLHGTGRLIGGSAAPGPAARGRAELEIERIMGVIP